MEIYLLLGLIALLLLLAAASSGASEPSSRTVTVTIGTAPTSSAGCGPVLLVLAVISGLIFAILFMTG